MVSAIQIKNHQTVESDQSGRTETDQVIIKLNGGRVLHGIREEMGTKEMTVCTKVHSVQEGSAE